jgi:hypothetical protein
MRNLIFLLILIPGISLAQNKKITNVTTGLIFSSDIYFPNDVSLTSTSQGYGYKSMFSHSQGLDIVLSFSDKFKISTGLFVSTKKFERTDYCYVCDVAYTPVSNFISRYFTIPVNAWYYFTNKRLDIYGIAGFSNSFNSVVKEFRTAYSGKIDEFNSKDDFRKYLVNINAGLGLNYNLTYRLSLGLNSIYQFYPGKFGLTPELKLSGINIQTGLYYKF